MGEGLQSSYNHQNNNIEPDAYEVVWSLLSEGENIYQWLDKYGDDPIAMLAWTRHVMSQVNAGNLADVDILHGLGHAWGYPDCQYCILERMREEHWPREQRSLLIEQIESTRKIADRGQPDSKKGKATLMSASDVQPLPLEWIWKPYLVRGMLAMLDGDPGVGKSLLTCTLAAAISRGWPLPDQQGKMTQRSEPASVLFLSAEDSLAHTIVPRLRAAQADESRIQFLTGVYGPEDEEIPYTLQNINALYQAMADLQPALVVIDPLQAYLGAINMNRANETRPLMMALAKLAETHRASVLCVRHPAKPGQDGSKALHRGLGSIDIIGAARTALFIDGHPTEPSRALMMQSKSNVGALGRTQIFSKAQGGFEWCGVTRADAELLAGNRRGPDAYAVIEAFFWLEKELRSDMPLPAPDMEARAKDEGGWSVATLRRARKALGVVARRVDGTWMWRLPSLEISEDTDGYATSSSSPTETSEPVSNTSLYRDNRDNRESEETRASSESGVTNTVSTGITIDNRESEETRASRASTAITSSYMGAAQDAQVAQRNQESRYSIEERESQKAQLEAPSDSTSADTPKPGYTGRHRLPPSEQADLDVLFDDDV